MIKIHFVAVSIILLLIVFIRDNSEKIFNSSDCIENLNEPPNILGTWRNKNMVIKIIKTGNSYKGTQYVYTDTYKEKINEDYILQIQPYVFKFINNENIVLKYKTPNKILYQANNTTSYLYKIN